MTEAVAPVVPRRARRPADSRARLMAAARKLFVERGYHDTRPQDVAREAGLGHGTFYLHFPDKRACFLGFVDEARAELDAYLQLHVPTGATLDGAVRAALEAIFHYGLEHPGVLATAMTDENVIAAEGVGGPTLVDRWAAYWADVITGVGGRALPREDAELIGASIVGMIHQGSGYAHRHGRPATETIDVLARLIAKAVS